MDSYRRQYVYRNLLVYRNVFGGNWVSDSGAAMKNLKISGIEITIVLCVLSLIFFPRMANNSIGEDEIYFITTSAQFEEWVNLETDAESGKLIIGPLPHQPCPSTSLPLADYWAVFNEMNCYFPTIIRLVMKKM